MPAASPYAGHLHRLVGLLTCRKNRWPLWTTEWLECLPRHWKYIAR